MRTAVLAVCLAGCSHPEGVAIEVHPGATTADTVELFIGRTACRDPDCGGIQPPGVDGKLPGTVAYRDGDAIDSAPMVDGVVTFQLQPDRGTETLPLVIAVGSTNGSPDSVAIIRNLEISSDPELVHATLSGATSHITSLPASMTIPDGDRIEVWRERNAPMSSCVVVQRWRDNQPEHLFVVPSDDPDCDDVPDGPLECDQDVFHASTAPDELPGQCVMSFQEMGGPICRIGGPGCTDGVGTTTCAPSPFCVPDVMCDHAVGCPSPDPACFLDRFANAQQITRITCTLPTEGGQPCMTPQTATIDLDPVFAPAMATCTAIGFYTAFSGGNELVFEPTLRFADGVMLVPQTKKAPCEVDVTWVNQSVTMPAETDRGLVEISIDNGQHIIVPIVVDYMPGQCATAQMMCSVDLGVSATTNGHDNVWNCVD